MRRIDLFAHNKEAYEKAERMMNEEGKAAIIHPTGTGKSFIAYALIERNPGKRFLWLGPSDYIYDLQMEKLWLKQHVRFKNVVFYTYNRLMWHEEEMEDIKPDFVILDEFHRAGAKEWGKTARRLLDMYPQARVLGLSATNIRYLDNRRDMADEIFEGCVASEMSICDAMAQGILPEPKYVITAYAYKEKVDSLEDKVEKMQNGYCKEKTRKLIERLRRALGKADGMAEIFTRHMPKKDAKVIIFCSDSDHMFEMASKVPEWFGKIDISPHVYRVYTYNPESEEDFQKFMDDDSEHLKLLFCIDMLNEGIHVDGVSAVVLCRPTISPIVYKQQIGRAIATGSVDHPVIFDLVNNFESLSPVADLQDEYKKAKGDACRLKPDNDDISGFEVIDELRDCRELMEQIQRNLDTTWDMCFREFVKYAEENGTTRIPRRYITQEGLLLGKWLQRQRAKYNEGKLTDEQISMFEKQGISWESVSDERFNHWMELLIDYKNEFGDLKVPNTYVAPRGEKLGVWCANIRIMHRQGKMLAERIVRLDDLEFPWDYDYYWDEGYEHAVEYYEEYGDIHVSSKYVCEDGYKLGSWLLTQRQVRRGRQSGNLDDRRIAMLNALGFDWMEKPIAEKDKYLEALEQYIKENGHDVIPSTYVTPSGLKLGPWLTTAKREYSQGVLPEQKKRILDDAGFKFHDFTFQWFERYLEAKKFYEENGNLMVSVANDNRDNARLRQWVNVQRKKYNDPGHGVFSEEQAKLLEEIGIRERSKLEQDFERGFGEFVKYREKTGEDIVPIDYRTEDDYPLGQWVCNQKDAYRTGKMRLDRYRRLNAAGMCWGNLNTVKAERYWNEMLEEARKYAAEHGSIHDLPVTYVTEDGKKLGSWVSQMRGVRKGKRKHSIVLDEEKVSMLDDIGMNWEPPLYKHTDKR